METRNKTGVLFFSCVKNVHGEVVHSSSIINRAHLSLSPFSTSLSYHHSISLYHHSQTVVFILKVNSWSKVTEWSSSFHICIPDRNQEERGKGRRGSISIFLPPFKKPSWMSHPTTLADISLARIFSHDHS